MRPRAVCFDVMGTLFDLAPLGHRLRAVGAPAAGLEAWFGRMLHTAASLTLSDVFRPFPEIAESTLRSLFAGWEIDDAHVESVLGGFAELDPYPDAARALERLSTAGLPVLALTNGAAANTRELLRRAGIERHVSGVVATEEVGAYKPDPRVYRRAVETLGLPPGQVTLVAAHAWDVVGARAAGLDALWVSRGEVRWPLPVDEAPGSADLEDAVTVLLGRPTA